MAAYAAEDPAAMSLRHTWNSVIQFEEVLIYELQERKGRSSP